MHQAISRLSTATAAGYTPLHHGGDHHTTMWWITFLSIVITGLVVVMAVCLIGAVRAANMTSERAAELTVDRQRRRRH